MDVVGGKTVIICISFDQVVFVRIQPFFLIFAYMLILGLGGPGQDAIALEGDAPLRSFASESRENDEGLVLEIAPPSGMPLSPAFPVLETESGTLVEYSPASGQITFSVNGQLACFDLREDWDASPTVVEFFDQNAAMIPGVAMFGAVAQLGLSGIFQYLLDVSPSALLLDAAEYIACFYDAGSGFGLFGAAGQQSGDLQVTVGPAEDWVGDWPFASVGDRVHYLISVTNTGDSNIQRLGIQELFPREGPDINFPVGLHHLNYECVADGGADCSDASQETIDLGGIIGEVRVPFIRGESVVLPAGETITFSITREIRLAGGGQLADTLGKGLPINVVALDLDNEDNHATLTETLQIVGTGDIIAIADEQSPMVSADGIESTFINVQAVGPGGDALNIAGIAITAELNEQDEALLNIPASALTDSTGVARFPVQSQRAGSYRIRFRSQALRVDGDQASTEQTLDFRAGPVESFSFSRLFDDPMVSPSALPSFSVTAIDEFGNRGSYDGGIQINLITPGGIARALGDTSAEGGVADFFGLSIPDNEAGDQYLIEARRSNPTIEGLSNQFNIIPKPTANILVNLELLTPNGGLSAPFVSQGGSLSLEVIAQEVDVVDGFALAVVLSVEGPYGSIGLLSDNDACLALFVPSSCQALLDAFDADNTFRSDGTLFIDELTVRADAPVEGWTLNFDLVLPLGQDQSGNDRVELLGRTSVPFNVSMDPKAATGRVNVARSGVEIGVDNNVVRQGRVLDLQVEVVDVSVGADIQVALDFGLTAPETSRIADASCGDLFTQASCSALSASFADPFTTDQLPLFSGPVELIEEAPTGQWTLSFSLLAKDQSEPEGVGNLIFERSVDLEVIESSLSGTLTVSGNSSDLDGQEYSQNQAIELVVGLESVDVDDFPGFAVLLEAEAPDGTVLEDATAVCTALFADLSCSNLSVGNLVTEDGPVLSSETSLLSDAQVGEWTLEFKVVAVGADQQMEEVDRLTVNFTVRQDSIFIDVFESVGN